MMADFGDEVQVWFLTLEYDPEQYCSCSCATSVTMLLCTQRRQDMVVQVRL